ncbi:hypothetical protein D018_2062A, partial [Vibrio parahaemolyticus VP2007-007]
MLCHLQLIG